MFYIRLIALIFVSTLIISCGSESDAACAHQVSIDLDSENYSAVIATLENNGTCNGEFSNEESWLNLGAAYMGSAGISVGALVTTITKVDPAEGIGGLLSAFDGVSNTSGLTALSNAQEVYGYITTGLDCSSTIGLVDYQEAACLYGGMANTLKGVGVLNAVLGDAITFLTTPVTLGDINDVNDNGTSDEIEITSCAIQEASLDDGACPETTITYNTGATGVTFTTTGFSDVYIPRTFTVTDTASPAFGGNQVYYRMIDQGAAIPSPVTTVGSCDQNFGNVGCPIDMTSCYPCPVVVDGAAPTVTNGLLELVNTGALDGADEGGSLTAVMDADSSGTVTEAELAAFLLTL